VVFVGAADRLVALLELLRDVRVARPAPCLGADTDDVLRTVCGYDDAAIARLRAADVLA